MTHPFEPLFYDAASCHECGKDRASHELDRATSTAHTPLPWQWDGDDLWHFGAGYDDPTDPHRFTGITVHRNLRDSEILKANKDLLVNRIRERDELSDALVGLYADFTALDKMVRRYVEASDRFRYDASGREMEEHYSRLCDDAYGSLRSYVEEHPVLAPLFTEAK